MLLLLLLLLLLLHPFSSRAVPASSGVTLPPLECLFTVEEEIGLVGAFNLDGSLVKGRTMLNLASLMFEKRARPLWRRCPWLRSLYSPLC